MFSKENVTSQHFINTIQNQPLTEQEYLYQMSNPESWSLLSRSESRVLSSFIFNLSCFLLPFWHNFLIRTIKPRISRLPLPAWTFSRSYIIPSGEEGRNNDPCWQVHCFIPTEPYLLSLLSLASVEITDGLSQVENCFLIDI